MRLFPIRACVAAIVAWAVVGSAALATVTNDRVYQLGDDLDEDAANAPGGVVGTGPGNVAPGVTIDTGNPGDGSGSFIDLLPIGNPRLRRCGHARQWTYGARREFRWSR